MSTEIAPAEEVDGEVMPPLEPAGTATTSALAVREVKNEVIRPLATADVKAAMVEHQGLLREILDPSDWQGQPDAQGSFVKKSGWRKIALAYNLGVERVSEEVERDETGMPLRASYTARAVAPNGRTMESTGHCSYDESRFSGPRGNKSKLENDMRATAETRAKNRAISDLIGMGKVSAEEVDAGAAAQAGPPYGPAASEALVGKAAQGVAFLLDTGDGPNNDLAAVILGKVETDCEGYLPAKVLRAFLLAAAELKAVIEAGDAPEPASPPAQTPAPQAAVPEVDASGTLVREAPLEPLAEEVTDAEVVPEPAEAPASVTPTAYGGKTADQLAEEF